MAPRTVWLVVLVGVLVVSALAIVYGRSANRPSLSSVSGSEASCAPEPCLAPSGFEAFFSQTDLSAGHLSVEVRFANHTAPQLLEAVSYRHTSPADFRIQWADGSEHAAIFSADCTDWGEIRIQRGGDAGPKRLCFDPPAQGLSEVTIVWDPDLGVFSTPVSTPLHP